MVTVYTRGGKKHVFKDANVYGIHGAGTLIQISCFEEGGTGFRNEHQVALFPADRVDRVEVEGGPKMSVAN